MFSPSIFWLWFAGLVALLVGIVVRHRELAASSGLDKLIDLAPVLYAAPLAVFGAEHFALTKGISQIVPAWMHVRLFWTYFVGCGLLAAALSFILNRYVHLSAALVGVMFFAFVALIHIPNAIASPHDRFAWTVVLRETSFAAGACAFASRRLIPLSRLCISIPLIFFAIEHFLHPQFAPGVPLAKMTPAWVPFPPFWGYLTGVILLVAGILILINKRTRAIAAFVGLWVTLLAVLLYLPIFLTDPPQALLEGVNYVADTLLFAGTTLLLAYAIARPPIPAPQSPHR